MRSARALSLALALVTALVGCTTGRPRGPDEVEVTAIESRSIVELSAAMDDGALTSEAITRAYLDRIAAIDDAGPTLSAVIAVMPGAIEESRARDEERRAGRIRGPLHGIPILLKDNIEARGPVPTTAGSLALAGNVTDRDAPLVARLRAAGAVILGKTNLSEWANIRAARSTSGWSAIGGLVKNPHALDRNACGSSSGSGAAVAAGLAAAAIGTETDGSITCPAGTTGIVGFKPTVGLVSRTHVIPISRTQDTAGPMSATVTDAAILLTAMAGGDPADPATAEADARKRDYVAVLDRGWLRGRRIGVLRGALGDRPEILAIADAAITTLRRAGAEVVDVQVDDEPYAGLGDDELTVLLVELKADLGAYLAGSPAKIEVRSLADVIDFNRAHPEELRWFDQSLFERAEAGPGVDAPAYLEALARARRLAGPEGIDRLLAADRLDLLMGVTNGPAWVSDLGRGDDFAGPSVSQLPAIAGYPHLTVPAGAIEGLPIGVSFIGGAWQDAEVLAAGFAFEQASPPRPRPRLVAGAPRPR
ncbi:MAG: amidase [Nannocystaceae bacterium]